MQVMGVDITAANDVALTVAVPRALLGQGLQPGAFSLAPRDASVPVIVESLDQRAAVALVFDTDTTADTRRARSAASELILLLPPDVRVLLPGLMPGAGDSAKASRAMERLLPQDDEEVLQSLESVQSVFASNPGEQRSLVILSSNRTVTPVLWAYRASVATERIRAMGVDVAAVNVAASGPVSSPFASHEVGREPGADVSEPLRQIAAGINGTYVVRARLPADHRPKSVTVAVESRGMRAVAVVRIPAEEDTGWRPDGLVLSALLGLALLCAGSWAFARRSSSPAPTANGDAAS
jgi:hypothetical protein